MAFSKLLTVLSIVVAASAASMVLHERRTAVPSGFVRLCRSKPLLNHPPTRLGFHAFASANGLVPTVISPNQDWVSITLPVSKANKLFAAEFDVFTHPSLKDSITRTLSVSLPSELVGHVDVIHPTTAFVVPNTRLVPPGRQINARGPAASCNSSDPSSVPGCWIEANLDIQYTVGIATGVPVEFLCRWTATLDDFPAALFDTTTFLDGIADPPTVMTTSYGFTESFFGLSVATKICNGYMALGARGISVGGVRGNHDSTTTSSCPWVTSVGSTQGFAPEKAINFTGGGFSNFSPRVLQTAAVDGYLDTIPEDFAGTFNKTGRGYPDVSLQGWNFQMCIGANFASIIALINDRLLAENKPVLGFLNPFLYSKASSAFTDVTTGHNSGFVCPASSVAFDAAVGWDPLINQLGLGTPIFPELLAAALA
ncbi:subtilisin-like protein [Mycena olivaceomarginata]|nr:subtilisin-like protein [Mycena olivaceomarginata]